VAFTYLKLKPTKCLCLLPVVLVLVLRILSCLHDCQTINISYTQSLLQPMSRNWTAASANKAKDRAQVQDIELQNVHNSAEVIERSQAIVAIVRFVG